MVVLQNSKCWQESKARERMSYPNIFPEDLIRIIKYEDLFKKKEKEIEVIDLEERETLTNQPEIDLLGEENEDESVNVEEQKKEDFGEDKETEEDDEKESKEVEEKEQISLKIEETKVVILPYFKEYSKNCKKYGFAPASFMNQIGETTFLDLKVNFHSLNKINSKRQ